MVVVMTMMMMMRMTTMMITTAMMRRTMMMMMMMTAMNDDDDDDDDDLSAVHGNHQENLLFSNDGKACAAHDFQYCGAGLGAKDIAYLFCAGLSSRYLPSHEEELLGHYHAELMGLLRPRGLGDNYTVDVLREHFGFALLDFVRFMDGWGYWGNNRWAAEKVEHMLKSSVAAALLNNE